MRGPQRSPRTRPSVRSISSSSVEERPRREARVDRDRAVQERRLVDDPDGIRLAQLRDRDDLDAVGRGEEVAGPEERHLARAEIRAEPDVRARHAPARERSTIAAA